MPTDYIKKLAKEGKGSVAELEKKWEEAKKAASKEGKAENYGYVTSIFKNMVGASAEPFRIKASARMQISADGFEGWINTLGYEYERIDGKQEAIIKAPRDEVWDKLKKDGWMAVRTLHGMTKGDHFIRVKPHDEDTLIVSEK